ncbi:phosphatidate cytidylyltransferase, mitochondrial isoform X12 [Heterocephalus glaber]|uniref:Phosphatidate cytidylyltransferase, mitochondrial n=1 Tax=Heterocephalus glaber TaxID=10181 RepID=A0AAX6SGA1_HETGA|nr:phosphatidate cytidylyltransferase, mitochondrial isoform X12 [Heterocephalus glaber]
MALQSSGVAFRRILSHFPEEVSLAFAYGSGVYRQAGPNSDQKNAMLDFVFTVDDPVAWHSKNLKKNWSHYSFLKLLGPKMIFSVQNNYGAGVYYNPLILCDGRLVKYGVISTSTLIEDLLGWNNLYIAGRLQKPVKIVAMNEDATLRSALDKNLRSAVTAAFLMLPESFSEEELFMEIAGLSYAATNKSHHGPPGEEQGCGGDPAAGGTRPGLRRCGASRAFSDRATFQHKTERQGHLDRCHGPDSKSTPGGCAQTPRPKHTASLRSTFCGWANHVPEIPVASPPANQSVGSACPNQCYHLG